uniref:DNA-directed DNA polymerase n=1 Tax=Meloidogyne hapla TaxID=6305 RepID=A0A1I8C2A8_MELHA
MAHNIKRYFREESVEQIRSSRFKIGVFRAAFTVINADEAPQGRELLLEQLIDHFFVRAYRGSGARSQKCSIIIRSSVLERPIQVPYRGLAQNTPQVVMEQFDTVDQSGQRMGRPSIYSQPINIEIVMGPSHEEALKLVRKDREGTGRRRREIHNGIDVNNIIHVQNEDLPSPYNRHCLLLAIQLTMLYVSKPKTPLASVQFQRLTQGSDIKSKYNRTQLIKTTLIQMKNNKIPYPRNERIYNVDEHVPLIQKLLDIQFPGQYRIAIFGEFGRTKSIWKCKKRARNDICLYLKDEHFSGIRKLNTFFGTDYYCLDCEATYKCKKTHRAKCLAKCPRCCGMGIDYPCEEIEGYMKQCNECNNLFRNPKCYHEHIMSNICILYKRCLDCGQIYRTKISNRKQETSDESEGASTKNLDHICYSRFCALCHSIHKTEEPCYVQTIVPKKQRDYLLIIKVIFDFECSLISPTRNEDEWQRLGALARGGPSSTDENYQLHHVNCVSAMLLCSRCISTDKLWKDEYSIACVICGKNKKRINTWTAATYVNPLREFLDWLIYGLGKERRLVTYAISHYGG